jgi:sialic acid synthase SpsE
MIILDFGSANTCQNDTKYIKRMYDELKAVDTRKHEVIVKWQLFEKAGENKPLLPECFEYAYEYGTKLGYKVTSSVFDKNSLDFLLRFDPCFVKIANNRNLDWLIGCVPRKVPVVVSAKNLAERCSLNLLGADTILACVSKYPATKTDYEDTFCATFNWPSDYKTLRGFIKAKFCKHGISDHTTNWDLFNKYKPEILEVHYKLSDSTGLDAGPFARTPEQLAEVL